MKICDPIPIRKPPTRAPERRRTCFCRDAPIVESPVNRQVVTAVLMPEGYNADRLREVILENFDMSLGTGLAKLAGKVFRIGHLGHFNDLMLAGTLGGVEMGLQLAGVPHKSGGVTAALNSLARSQRAVTEEVLS